MFEAQHYGPLLREPPFRDVLAQSKFSGINLQCNMQDSMIHRPIVIENGRRGKQY